MRGAIERRRFRRAELEAPVVIRAMDADGAAEQITVTGQAKNVSLAGLYCHVKGPCPFVAGQRVLSSIVFSEEQVRLFPFARVLGQGWVTRVEPVLPGGKGAGDDSSGQGTLVGVTVAFAPDVTALGMLESS